MASDIRVVKEQLGEFAGKVDTESTDMATRVSNNSESLFSGSTAAATSSMPSAKALFLDHTAVVNQFQQYVADQMVGLMALNMGALSIQSSYTAADDESAHGMQLVDGVFNPADGTMSVQSLLQDVDNGSGAQAPQNVQDQLPQPDDLTPDSYQAPAPSEAMPGTQDADGQTLTHDNEQAQILYGLNDPDGPGGPLDTAGLDDDLEETYQDERRDAALVQGMGYGY